MINFPSAKLTRDKDAEHAKFARETEGWLREFDDYRRNFQEKLVKCKYLAGEAKLAMEETEKRARQGSARDAMRAAQNAATAVTEAELLYKEATKMNQSFYLPFLETHRNATAKRYGLESADMKQHDILIEECNAVAGLRIFCRQIGTNLNEARSYSDQAFLFYSWGFLGLLGGKTCSLRQSALRASN